MCEHTLMLCGWMCVCLGICMCMCICMFEYVYIRTCPREDGFMWRLQVWMCAHVYVHVREHIHVYVCMFVFDITHSYVTWLLSNWRDPFICDMIIHMWHDSFTSDTTHLYVTWFIHMWHDAFIREMPHPHVTIHSFICACMCSWTHPRVQAYV